MSATTTNNNPTPKKTSTHQPSNPSGSSSSPPTNNNNNGPRYIVTKYLNHFDTPLSRAVHARHFSSTMTDPSSVEDSSMMFGGQIALGRIPIQADATKTSQAEADALAERWIEDYKVEHPGCSSILLERGALQEASYGTLRQDGLEHCEVVVRKFRL
ncbi:MAG: hypothetical protein Q9228_007535 [Teloschistes exilis]